MDDIDAILDNIFLSEKSIVNQMISFFSIINILVAAALGLLILFIYSKIYYKKQLNTSLIITLPVLSVLMTVLMRMQGGQAVVFFGIFGVLSIVRFRSSSDQDDIPFILFSIITGVLVGTGNYILSLMAFVIVSIIIITINIIFNRSRFKRRAVVSFRSSSSITELQKIIEAFCRDRNFGYSIESAQGDVAPGADQAQTVFSNKLEYTITYRSYIDLISEIESFQHFGKEKGIEISFKKSSFNL